MGHTRPKRGVALSGVFARLRAFRYGGHHARRQYSHICDAALRAFRGYKGPVGKTPGYESYRIIQRQRHDYGGHHGKKLGSRIVACASTGNTSASMAAYAARQA